MIKTFFLALILVFIWSSEDLRSATSNALILMAELVSPEEERVNNPKSFEIPNPFYVEDKE